MDENLEQEQEPMVWAVHKDPEEEPVEEVSETNKNLDGRILGIGTALVGIGGAVVYKNREKIADWFRTKKATRRAKKAAWHQAQADKLNGVEPDVVEEA